MSKWFSLKEMTYSDTAVRKGIDNTPTDEAVHNLLALVDNVLDPLREAYGKPVHVNSGYRCSRLNEAVGGVNSSEHRLGAAADIVGTPNTKEENAVLFELIQSLGLPFRQLIWEKGGQWIHVSYRRDRENDRQVLKTK